MFCAIMLNSIMLSVTLLSDFMLGVVSPNVIWLSVVRMSVVRMSVIRLSVVIPSVVAFVYFIVDAVLSNIQNHFFVIKGIKLVKNKSAFQQFPFSLQKNIF
jgi:hypothetical protein